MNGKSRLITLMLASTIVAGLTSCAQKSNEEKRCEEEIRKLLEYDAGIDIDNSAWGGGFGRIDLRAKDNEYLIIFTSKTTSAKSQKVIYSVDKDFYYYFKHNYSTVETDKEITFITELTLDYDPIEVVVD